jgi:cyclophilin family peptidyl-prolyl cis-trans isomerase
MKTKLVLLSTAALLLSGCSSPGQMEPVKNEIKTVPKEEAKQVQSTPSINTNTMDYAKQYSQAIITTNLGKITVKFYSADSPATVNNFLKLASEKFYDGTKFHRVIKGFMIQGGDPNSKTADTSSWGMGGPGYKFNDELKGTEKYPQGTLAMANSGPNTNGSQFFIVTASPAAPLPPSYTVFGTVVSGMDIALKIENVKTVSPGQVDRPVEDVVIQSIVPME